MHTHIVNRHSPLYTHRSAQALLDCMGSGRDLTVAVEQALPVLLEKLGDSNARIRDSARDAIVALAHHKDAGLKGLASQFVKPAKSQTAWRPVLSTLQLLQDLVPQLGVGRSADGSGGFEVEELMEYLSKAFNSPNAEVRAAAVKVAAAAHELAGVAVRRLLPRDLNPKIKEQLDAAFGVESSGGCAFKLCVRWFLSMNDKMHNSNALWLPCTELDDWQCQTQAAVPRTVA